MINLLMDIVVLQLLPLIPEVVMQCCDGAMVAVISWQLSKSA